MSDFTITIDCNNQAWFDDAEGEMAHVMSQLTAHEMLHAPCGSKQVLRTSDGSPTGLLTISPVTRGADDIR